MPPVETKLNPFHFTTPISDFELNVAESFKKKLKFTYDGGGDTVIYKLSGNPKTTGIQCDGVVHEPDGSYSILLYGTPRIINKNELILTLRDNRNNIFKFPIVFRVIGLKINPATLPDAVGLFTPYTSKIYFENPTPDKLKFSYNFPVEFGQVKTEIDDGLNYTTIMFSPSKVGKFKFHIEVLNEDNITFGERTMNVTVFDSLNKKKVRKVEAPTVRAIDMKDWKN